MVAEDVILDGLCLIPSGVSAGGVVTEAEPRRRMGKGAKIGLGVEPVHQADNEKARARSFEVSAGTDSTGSILPVAHGKDVVFAEGMGIAASIDGNVRLKRASFQPLKNTVGPAQAVSNPPQLL